MILTAIQTNELGQMMREHITCILRMEAVRLDLDWAAEFSPKQILSCCDRMIEHLDCTINFSQNVQRELICSPEFASWLAQLMALVGKAAADAGVEDAPPSWDALVWRLDKLLEVCRSSEKSVTSYSEEDTLFVLKQIDLTADARLAYLESFAATAIDDGAKEQVIKSLSACNTVPITLNDGHRELLAEPFVATRYLFTSANFEDVWALFQFCPTLTDIARLLHERGIDECLSMTDYQYFAEDGAEYLRLLTLVLQRLSATAASGFLHHWQENNCALSELHRMERRMGRVDAGELDAALSSYPGYVNLIYGSRFKTISLNGLTSYQKTILLYAITHDKKHFIRLIDENAEKFLGLTSWSILFYETLYRQHFNLNELTAKDLDDCSWMVRRNLPKNLLKSSCQYTFPELKLLYDAPEAYITLYHKLHGPRLDDRIKVLRQLRKRNVLREITGEAELTALAERLDQKPLADWRQGEFGHIRDIQAEDAAQMLIHLNQLRPLLTSIQCRADVMLALRCLEHIDQFDSIEALKANLLEVDQYWKELADAMELTSDFKERHQQDIVKFLCRDGAGIAWTYLDYLTEELHPAFHRVVKAELMGQFNDLKYHAGDLEQELDYPLGTQAKVEWRENLTLTQGGIEARERDDFFSTMLLGTQPYSTCLSYRDGAYCSSLLACFDSNKKVLYAEMNGEIVGRACIRLTKCCLNGEPKNRKEPAGKFSFVDLENVNDPPEARHQGETLALFLERPYISGVDPAEQLQVEALFITLVRQKADALGAMMVLSLDYLDAAKEGFAQTYLHLYISASKAGGQYLDSLGGKAEVSSEGSYKKNTFLLDRSKGLTEKADETVCA